MGLGFCYVVGAGCAERTLAILKAHGRVAQVIGTAVSDPQKIVRIPARGLAGQHKRFWREGGAARRACDCGCSRRELGACPPTRLRVGESHIVDNHAAIQHYNSPPRSRGG
jgi:hypothetical protein